MFIRPYRSADCPALAELFYETVHTVCARDYPPEQLDVWAPGEVDLAAWDASFLAHRTLAAVEGETIVGFADMDGSGYLDRLYVHRDFQRRGVASALCDALEAASAAETMRRASAIESAIGFSIITLQPAAMQSRATAA